jgi:hypothetical protein
MTGLELYIKDINGNFHCYKQRHDGYYIQDYLKEKIDTLFLMNAKEIIEEFHNKFFKTYSDYNYHPNGSQYEYGIEIPGNVVNSKEFSLDIKKDNIYTDLDGYINTIDEYKCGYCDYVVYIDLISGQIIGDDDIDEMDDDFDYDEDDYPSYMYNKINK